MRFHETSLFGVLKYGGTQNMELYNCSAKTREQWFATGRAQPELGWALLAYGVVIEILYIPSLYVISRPAYRRMPCYKIMCLLGPIDMCAIVTNSIVNGYLLTQGAVFCTIFNIILSLPILYGAYFFWFTPPVLFTSVHDSWFFDPFIFEGRTAEYMNPPHTLNNLLLCALTCCLYTALCGLLAHQFGYSSDERKMSWAQKSIFIQATSICIANLVAALVYVFMQFFPTPQFFILLGHFGWELCHGFPAIVYLTINRSIRREVFRCLGFGAYLDHSKRHTAESRKITSMHAVSTDGVHPRISKNAAEA
ncbi:unnamed protein product, partial [Mesorhabditis spiculigera]